MNESALGVYILFQALRLNLITLGLFPILELPASYNLAFSSAGGQNILLEKWNTPWKNLIIH